MEKRFTVAWMAWASLCFGITRPTSRSERGKSITKATFYYHKGLKHESSRIFSEQQQKRHLIITEEKKRTQRIQSETMSTSNFVFLGAFFVKIMSLWVHFENSGRLMFQNIFRFPDIEIF